MKSISTSVFSMCMNPQCPNYRKGAKHPRSDNPEICGMCGEPVRIFKAERGTKIEEVEFKGGRGNTKIGTITHIIWTETKRIQDAERDGSESG